VGTEAQTHEELAAERDFLLRSLDDLELERAAGNIEPAEYDRIKDDYTARAAAVLRAMRDGIDTRVQPAPLSGRRRGVVIGGIVVFALIAAFLLTTALGNRLPGQSVTGNAQTIDAAQARITKATGLMNKNDYFGALKEFDAAYKLDPKNALARAYTGWMVFLLRSAVDEKASVAKAQQLEDDAIALSPSFPDAHFFKGMVLLQGKQDPAGAAAEFEKFLQIVPTGPEADRVRALLQQATTTTTRSP
jgi:tetratricopeptide (TPR) repeat protein